MRRLVLAFTVAASIATAAPASAQRFWGGLSRGDAAATVRQAYPEAKVTTGGSLRGGETPQLVLDGIVVGQTTFSATFYFLGAALEAVVLKADPGGPPLDMVYRDLQPALSEKYGPAYDCQQGGGTGWDSAHCEWRSDETSIRLQYYGGGQPSLTIGYRAVQRMSDQL